MKKPKIIIKRAGKNKKQFMVVVVGTNGKVLLTSELLSSPRNCRNNIYASKEVFLDLINRFIKVTEDY